VAHRWRPLRTRLAPFARFGERGAGGRDRVFKGSKVDLTSRPRDTKSRKKRRKRDARADICVKLTIRSNEDHRRISILQKWYFHVAIMPRRCHRCSGVSHSVVLRYPNIQTEGSSSKEPSSSGTILTLFRDEADRRRDVCSVTDRRVAGLEARSALPFKRTKVPCVH